MRTPPFDLEGALQSPVTVDFPIQQVIANGGFVYCAGRKFDAETLALIDDFGDDIIVVTPAGDLALSRTKIYGTDCFCELGGLPRDSPLIAVDPQSEVVYQFDNSTGALFVQALP